MWKIEIEIDDELAPKIRGLVAAANARRKPEEPQVTEPQVCGALLKVGLAAREQTEQYLKMMAKRIAERKR